MHHLDAKHIGQRSGRNINGTSEEGKGSLQRIAAHNDAKPRKGKRSSATGNFATTCVAALGGRRGANVLAPLHPALRMRNSQHNQTCALCQRDGAAHQVQFCDVDIFMRAETGDVTQLFGQSQFHGTLSKFPLPSVGCVSLLGSFVARDRMILSKRCHYESTFPRVGVDGRTHASRRIAT